jgi:hypothetical protein
MVLTRKNGVKQMSKAIKLYMPSIRKKCIAQWEKDGRKGAFLRVYVDRQNGKIYYDTMTERFPLVGWVIAKVKGVYTLLTTAEKEKADFSKLFAAMGNA